MIERQGKFWGAGGLELFGQSWAPDSGQPPRAVVAVLHGLGEHGGRHPRPAQALTGRGLALWAHDYRGHGRSGGARGHIHAWSDFRDDLRASLRQAQTDFPGSPLFLYGHSLGSLIALDYLLHDVAMVRGAVVCGCALDPAGTGTPITRAGGRAELPG